MQEMFCSMNVKVVLSVDSIPPVLCSVTHVLPSISTWRLIIDVINETKANYIPICQYIFKAKESIHCQGR
jgi:hypothetical protein